MASVSLDTALALVTVITATYIICRRFLDPLHSIPGPPLWSFTQLPWHIHNLRGRLPYVLADLHAKYGPVVRIGPNEVSFAATRLATWRAIYARKPEMPKNPHGTGPPPPATGVPGIVHAAAPAHARMRAALAPAFSERALRAQEPLIGTHTTKLMMILGAHADGNAIADIAKFFNLATFDITGDLAFGESFGGLDKGAHHPWVGTILAQVRAMSILQLLVHYGLYRFERLLMPRAIAAQRARFWATAREKVDRRLAEGAQRADMLGLMERGSLDVRELHVNAAVLTIAGSETSASHLSSAVYFLLSHPAEMQRVQREMRSTFASAEDITIATVSRLKYLPCVMQECFRLHPPAPATISRVVPEGGEVIEGWAIPTGTAVGIPQFSTNRAAGSFHDPLRFAPERWLPDGERPREFDGDKREVVRPFGFGNRGCIGQSLAELEIRLVLCQLLFRFDIEGVPGFEKWLDHRAYLSWERKPLHVWLKHRSPAA